MAAWEVSPLAAIVIHAEAIRLSDGFVVLSTKGAAFFSNLKLSALQAPHFSAGMGEARSASGGIEKGVQPPSARARSRETLAAQFSSDDG